MFGFHKRGRSLIPVKDLDKLEGVRVQIVEIEEEEEEAEVEVNKTPRQKRNLMMIYLLFLAEAIMAASLSSQIAVLVPSANRCMGVNASFLRSVFECAYFLGSTSGLFWGLMVDRLGRRKVALAGLCGMVVCCFSMGFATGFAAFAALRFVAGVTSSAVTVAGLSMLADETHGTSDRTKTVARLPLVAVCGSVGPLAATVVRELSAPYTNSVFARFQGLSGQLVCATLVSSIAVAEVLLLSETLPSAKPKASHKEEEYQNSEKASFLGQSLANDSDSSLNISIIDALNDDAVAPPPSHLTINQMLTAPSVILLLASYAIVSLHTSTFDILLPHLGHHASHEGGMDIACEYLTLIVTGLKAFAAFRILHFVPLVVKTVGLLPMYRRISMAFPVMYLFVPLVGLLVGITGTSVLVTQVASMIAIFVKAIYGGAAQVLVLLLVLSATPDASSTGTVIGVVSVAELFKALAVGVSGVSYYLSDEYSSGAVNFSLWAALVVVAAVGSAISWRLRETPRVGTDIPEHCLTWQGMFDAESDEEAAF